jgi:hypothetical protein
VTGATIVLHLPLARYSRKFASFDINSEGKTAIQLPHVAKNMHGVFGNAKTIHFHILLAGI